MKALTTAVVPAVRRSSDREIKQPVKLGFGDKEINLATKPTKKRKRSTSWKPPINRRSICTDEDMVLSKKLLEKSSKEIILIDLTETTKTAFVALKSKCVDLTLEDLDDFYDRVLIQALAPKRKVDGLPLFTITGLVVKPSSLVRTNCGLGDG